MCVSEERGLGRGGEGREKGREESSLFSNSSVRHQSQYLVQRCLPQTHVGEAVVRGGRWEVEGGDVAHWQCTTYVHMYILTYAHTSSRS